MCKENISMQARNIIDASAKKNTSRKLAELIYCLINDLPLKIDPSIVESTTIQVMKNNHIAFKSSLVVIMPEDNQESFEDIVDFFFDAVCKPGTDISKIESLINLCINL